jgi:uncharacterized protein YcfJ
MRIADMATENSAMKGVLLVAGAVASIGVVGALVVVSRPQFAQVVDVQAVTKPARVKVRECADAAATKKAAPDEARSTAGTAIEGMAGGVIKPPGTGSTLSAAVAAPAGRQERTAATVGDAAVKKAPRCRMVSHVRTVQQVIAYDVRYRLDGRLGQVRMEHHPGKKIPVKEGRLVLAGEGG